MGNSSGGSFSRKGVELISSLGWLVEGLLLLVLLPVVEQVGHRLFQRRSPVLLEVPQLRHRVAPARVVLVHLKQRLCHQVVDFLTMLLF